MIIEGEVPVTETEEEGPHAEMFGYLGKKREANFFMNIEAITHRQDPGFSTTTLESCGVFTRRLWMLGRTSLTSGRSETWWGSTALAKRPV